MITIESFALARLAGWGLGKVFPRLSFANIADKPLANAKPSGGRGGAVGRKQNRPRLFFRKSPARVAATFRKVATIVGMSAHEKVVGIHASPVMALVSDEKPSGDRPLKRDVTQFMSGEPLQIDAGGPVSVATFRPAPLPTPGFGDNRPVADIFGRVHLCNWTLRKTRKGTKFRRPCASIQGMKLHAANLARFNNVNVPSVLTLHIRTLLESAVESQ